MRDTVINPRECKRCNDPEGDAQNHNGEESGDEDVFLWCWEVEPTPDTGKE
jgi:hypothetical protein